MRIALFADPASPHTRVWAQELLTRGVGLEIFSAQKSAPPRDLGVPVFAPLARGVDVPPEAESTRGKPNRVTGSWELRRISRAMRLAPVAHKWLEHVQPDVSVALRLQPEGLVAALAGARPLGLVSWGQDVLHFALGHPLHRAFARFAVARAARLWGETEPVVEGWRRLGASPSRVARAFTGIDSRFWMAEPPAGEQTPVSHAVPYVFSPRALAPRGHQVELTRAWLDHTAEHALALVVAGGGDPATRTRCRAMAAEAGRDAEWIDLGAVEPALLRALYRESAVVASLWRPDGLSQSLLEAMAAGGVPLVADQRGTREWIEDGVNGVLVEPDDPLSIGLGLTRALDLPREHVQEENERRIREGADRTRNMDRWTEELYRMALERQGAARP